MSEQLKDICLRLQVLSPQRQPPRRRASICAD
jgi:hypothetical protein